MRGKTSATMMRFIASFTIRPRPPAVAERDHALSVTFFMPLPGRSDPGCADELVESSTAVAINVGALGNSVT
jgi:hypothetical protein